MRSRKLRVFYQKLYAHFGPQHWWPAQSPFEVMIGAILTQNTNWANVEKAINKLKTHRLLSFSRLNRISHKRLASLIKAAGYYNIKAKRIKEFLKFLSQNYKSNLKKMARRDIRQLRGELLSVNGIGPETADSILLYALNKPVFVIDAYTKRILLRHKFIKDNATYDEIQSLFMQNLKKNTRLFNEFHALLVKLGKEYCLKSKPKCKLCPLG